VRIIITGYRDSVRHPKARKISLSGRSIIPILQETPIPSALALTYEIRNEAIMHNRLKQRARSSEILKKYNAIPKNIKPSAILSRVESSKAPNLVTLPFTLAIMPSSISKTPPKRIITPPQKRLTGIKNAEDAVIIIPRKVIKFGLNGRTLAKGLRGLSRKWLNFSPSKAIFPSCLL